MAEDKQTTPEQQLLKLIEEQNRSGPKGASQAPAAAAPAPRKANGLSLAKMPGALLGRLSFWKRKTKKKARVGRLNFGIAEINKVLATACAALFIYVVFDAGASARNLQRPPNFAPPKELQASVKKETLRPLEETSYYLEKVSSRDIFKEGPKEAVVESAAPLPNLVEETAEAIQNLALVGISWSSNPDAIVEDKSQQRTYFVKRGQMVGENVKVEAIFKDHVVVSFEDKEYELR